MSTYKTNQTKNKTTNNTLDLINPIIEYVSKLTKHTVFLSGFVVIFYFYYLKNRSSNTSIVTSSQKSYSRIIIIGLLIVFFYKDIKKLMYKNIKNNKNNKENANDNPIYLYGTQIKERDIKTSKLDRNTNEIWKKIKKFRHTSPELVKDLYYQLQSFQHEIKELPKKETFLYQHFDKLNDRKEEIINLLESLEYTQNIDLSRLRNDTNEFLILSLKQVKDKIKINTLDLNATCSTIHITNDVYSME